MPIAKPTEVEQLSQITAALDAADHDARVAWCRSLNGTQLYRLFELAKDGGPLAADDLVGDEGEVVIHKGKNGVPVFTYFEKRFVRLGDQIAGYNDGHETAPIGNALYSWITGPGHYICYDSPEVPGEVWVDYRTIPSTQCPQFPPLLDNDSGLRSLIFGNMVDIIRRVSTHVVVGDATKSLPSPQPLRLGARIGGLLATAPFILCQPPRA
jgi:hypothetical protein